MVTETLKQRSMRREFQITDERNRRLIRTNAIEKYPRSEKSSKEQSNRMVLLALGIISVCGAVLFYAFES